ncbi:hypothetical protein SLS58_009856 [Diplodia intermedia]|uniref:Uncharacterized protein n=1 Tax=Diplodia intermedia TaxID=856260 RepID=A0ABR3TAG0_9PEZI
MPLLNLRELISFPDGNNATDTEINGVHFNLTALEQFNYTIYDNGTISNASRCYLIFSKYQPVMMSNGSWINGTSCYLPYYRIHARGGTGIGFACLFGASIMFTLINLRKHGRLFLREDKRFRVIGRRWQWYWMCFVAACGMISTIAGVDVDRYYLQSLPIILQSFFYTLMLPGTLAMVWEAVRHWGSWQERQIYDRDPFHLPQDDRRSRPESGGLMARINSFCAYCPTKLFLALNILAIRIAYALASAWIWDISLMKYDVQPGWPYGLGYGTTALLLILFNIFGYIDPNEDKVIIEQRRERGHAADAELGITMKPSWWRKAQGDLHLTPEQRLRALATQGPEADRQGRDESPPSANVELGDMSGNPPAYYDVPGSGQIRNRSRQRTDNAPENPFRDPHTTHDDERRGLRRADSDDNESTATGTTERTGMTGETLAENYPPQRVRSMLDV